MKNIKNKIAAIVCGIALLCGTVATTAAIKGSAADLPFMNCTIYAFEACGNSVAGIICGDEIGRARFIADQIAGLCPTMLM